MYTLTTYVQTHSNYRHTGEWGVHQSEDQLRMDFDTGL